MMGWANGVTSTIAAAQRAQNAWDWWLVLGGDLTFEEWLERESREELVNYDMSHSPFDLNYMERIAESFGPGFEVVSSTRGFVIQREAP